MVVQCCCAGQHIECEDPYVTTTRRQTSLVGTHDGAIVVVEYSSYQFDADLPMSFHFGVVNPTVGLYLQV